MSEKVCPKCQGELALGMDFKAGTRHSRQFCVACDYTTDYYTTEQLFDIQAERDEWKRKAETIANMPPSSELCHYPDRSGGDDQWVYREWSTERFQTSTCRLTLRGKSFDEIVLKLAEVPDQECEVQK
jgi:hypothetical protein